MSLPSVGIVHVGVAGARGRMGRAVSAVLDGRPDVVTAARFDRGDTPDLSICDVVIDFTEPDGSVELAQRCAAAGRPALVVGSTGLSPEQEDQLREASKSIAMVRSGNFSLGVNLLIGLVEQAARSLPTAEWDAEIVEAHHRRKVDAPSGTALMLAGAVARGRGQVLDEVRGRPRDGIVGPRTVGEIGMSVIRAGGVIGEHQAIFGAEDEVVTLSHSARDRGLFARGAVSAALWVCGKPPGLYDMQDVLGFARRA